MSREIKFRAWDKRRNKWIEQESLVINNGLLYEDRRDFEDGEPLSDDDAELVGYTGLKDKNGVEIYEGDILEMAEQSLLRFEVVYDAGHMAFMRNWIDKRVPAIRCKGEMEHLSANTDFLEVIGNRFENPELLEGNQ